jgi:hypothetical protein
MTEKKSSTLDLKSSTTEHTMDRAADVSGVDDDTI